MKRLLTILIFLLACGNAWGQFFCLTPTGTRTTGYSTAGDWSNTSCYEQILTMYQYGQANGTTAHTVYIAPGTYNDAYSYFNLAADSKWNNFLLFGVSAAGVTANCNGVVCQNYPAAMGVVVITPPSGQTALRASTYNGTYKNLTITGAISTGKNAMYAINNVVTADNIYIHDITGAATVGVQLSGSAALTMSRSKLQNMPQITGISTSTLTLTTSVLDMGSFENYQIQNSGTGAWTITNNDIFPSSPGYEPLYNNGGGSMVVKNNNVYGGEGTTGNFAVLRNSGAGSTADVENNSLIIFPHSSTGLYSGYFSGTGTAPTDLNNLKNSNPVFTHNKRKGIVIPSMDDFNGDANQLQFAKDFSDLLKTYNVSATAYVVSGTLGSTGTDILALSTRNGGNIEIGDHTDKHSNMSLTTGFTCTGATVTVNKTTDSIDAGSGSTTFKSSSLGQITTWLAAHGATSCTMTTGMSASVLGEALATGTYTSGTAVALDMSTGTAGNPPTSGYYYSEITQSKAILEALLGHSVYSFAFPGNAWSADARTAVLNSGFWSARDAYSATHSMEWATWRSGNIDSMAFATIDPIQIFGNDQATTNAKVHGIADYLAHEGAIIQVLTHGYSTPITSIDSDGGLIRINYGTGLLGAAYANGTVTIVGAPSNTGATGVWHTTTMTTSSESLTGSTYTNGCSSNCGTIYLDTDIQHWGWVLEELAKYPDLMVMSAKQAVDYLQANFATTDDRTYTYTWPDNSNYVLQKTSTLIGTGSNTPWTGQANATDYAGNAITDAAGVVIPRWVRGIRRSNVDIGAIQTQSSGGPAGGSSFQKFNMWFRF